MVFIAELSHGHQWHGSAEGGRRGAGSVWRCLGDRWKLGGATEVVGWSGGSRGGARAPVACSARHGKRRARARALGTGRVREVHQRGSGACTRRGGAVTKKKPFAQNAIHK